MKVKVLKRQDNELKIEIEGSSHGLCNLLAKRLLEDKPLISQATICRIR